MAQTFITWLGRDRGESFRIMDIPVSTVDPSTKHVFTKIAKTRFKRDYISGKLVATLDNDEHKDVVKWFLDNQNPNFYFISDQRPAADNEYLMMLFNRQISLVDFHENLNAMSNVSELREMMVNFQRKGVRSEYIMAIAGRLKALDEQNKMLEEQNRLAADIAKQAAEAENHAAPTPEPMPEQTRRSNGADTSDTKAGGDDRAARIASVIEVIKSTKDQFVGKSGTILKSRVTSELGFDITPEEWGNILTGTAD